MALKPGIMAAPLGHDSLPARWSYGVCSDGRVFFINDESQSTTWLHPRTGEPVNSGHMIRSDLPRGWEEGFTAEGACYFINHNQRVTAFRHPVTGQISPENTDYILQERPGSQMAHSEAEPRPSSLVSESSTNVTCSTVETSTGSKGSRSSGKVLSFGKREQSVKRNLNVPVVIRGWLYKQDSSGMRLWRRKWFVLSEYCLFYYKDSREEAVLGSIPLPSYVISPVEPEDHINRKYAFKACHMGMRAHMSSRSSVIGWQAEQGGMRTYYFSADTQEDMSGWVRCLNQAALLQGPPRESDSSATAVEISDRQAGPQANHANSCSTSPAQAEAPPLEVGEEMGEGLVEEMGAEPGEEEEPFARSTPTAEVPPQPQAPPPSSPPHTSQLNGLPPPEQNRTSLGERGGSVRWDADRGGATQQRGADRQVQRKTALAQVERWVKVQKGADTRSLPASDHALPWRTPPPQPKHEAYQSLPKLPPGGRGLTSEYQYAADRLSLARVSLGGRGGGRGGTVWQLYEWQQRQRYRHGSPTAPGFASVDPPLSVSVPPSASVVPPSQATPSRRPHTPAERVTVLPLDPPLPEVPPSMSPCRLRSQTSKTSLTERRSMPPIGYITHTVSAPSLHGKTPEELTLLLIQLERHQARMASVRNHALMPLHNGPCGPRLQADDTYIQMKQNLDYLDLKVTGRETLRERSTKPLKIAESDVDVKLSRLCEQDTILQDLESRIRSLKEDKEKLESVLDVSHQQMEQYRDQPPHAEKIAYQQRLLQEDLVHILAEISRVSTEMEGAWDEYSRLEMDLVHLQEALQDHLTHSVLSQQEKQQIRRELWRIEDVMSGLSATKSQYQASIHSVKNPERKLVPSMSLSSVPSLYMSKSMGDIGPPPWSPGPPSPDPSPSQAPQSLQLMEDSAPPRPPLPQLYSPEESPPVVPPLPREASAVRHTSVRGLKRQADERRRDREGQSANGEHKVELRSCLSEPELWALGGQSGGLGPPGLDGGLTGSTSQSESVSSYVTLRRNTPAPGLKRPQSALEQLYSGGAQRGGRMSAEEQLERMKRHQKALLRERKRTLSQGERAPPRNAHSHAAPAHGPAPGHAARPYSADLASGRREQAFDLQLLERAVPGEERRGEGAERLTSQSDEWLTVQAIPLMVAMEPLDYDLDLSRELAVPEKVCIPERYVDQPEEPLTPEEREARRRKAQQIRSVLARSSLQSAAEGVCVMELDSAVQEQERIISISHTLASEASQLSRVVAEPQQEPPPPSPAPPASPAPQTPLSSGVNYTFV